MRGTARLLRDCAALDALTAVTARPTAPQAQLEERVGPDLTRLLIRALAPSGTQVQEHEPRAAGGARGSA